MKLANVVPMEKSPEILAERASSIVKKLGYESPPVDKAYGFGLDESYLKYVDEQWNAEQLAREAGFGPASSSIISGIGKARAIWRRSAITT